MSFILQVSDTFDTPLLSLGRARKLPLTASHISLDCHWSSTGNFEIFKFLTAKYYKNLAQLIKLWAISHSSHPKKESSDRANLQDFAPLNVITVCLACISGAKLNFMVDPSLYSKNSKNNEDIKAVETTLKQKNIATTIITAFLHLAFTLKNYIFNSQNGNTISSRLREYIHGYI